MPDLTITYSVANGQRVANALQKKWGLELPASAAEVKQYIINELRNMVLDIERRQAQEAVTIATLIIT